MNKTSIKKCQSCRNSLPITNFKTSLRTKDGYQVNCVECSIKAADYQRKRYQTDAAFREQKKKVVAERAQTPEMRKYAADYQRKRYERDAAFREQKKKAVNKRLQNSDAKKRHQAQVINWQNRAYANDPQYRLSKNLATAMRSSLRGRKDGNSWESLVDYSLEQLTAHLESQFDDGMSWANYGDWHIDHRTPVSWFSFDSADDASFKECWALVNLKPMWAEDNRRKGNRYAD